MAFTGVDPHTNSITVCRLEADGTGSFETFQLALGDPDRLCESLNADDEIAAESTGNSARFRDQALSPTQAITDLDGEIE